MQDAFEKRTSSFSPEPSTLLPPIVMIFTVVLSSVAPVVVRTCSGGSLVSMRRCGSTVTFSTPEFILPRTAADETAGKND